MVSIDAEVDAIKRDPLELLDRNRIIELCQESGYRPEADGKLDPPTLIALFMRQIAAMTNDIVTKAKENEHDTIPGDFGMLKVPCPKCGGEVHEKYKAFQCVKCDFSLRKIISGKLFEYQEVEALIRDKQAGPLQGFRSKMGKPFAAVLRLTPEYKIEFDFGQDRRDGDGAPAEVDFTGQEPIGKCPKCQNRVFDTAMSYVCEKATGAKRTCDFRVGKIILQQAVELLGRNRLVARMPPDGVLAGGLLDKELVLGRAAGMFAGLGRQRAGGHNRCLVAPHRLLIERGSAQVPSLDGYFTLRDHYFPV